MKNIEKRKQLAIETRKRVKKKLVDLELDAYGSKKKIADVLGVNYSEFIMAMTGSRNRPASIKILNMTEAYLDSLKSIKAA